MREQDTFEPDDDPYDETPSEEDLPDETDAERNICLHCGHVLDLVACKWHGFHLVCPECVIE